MPATAGLVLAAGEGRRFGGPKAPFVLDGERLVQPVAVGTAPRRLGEAAFEAVGREPVRVPAYLAIGITLAVVFTLVVVYSSRSTVFPLLAPNAGPRKTVFKVEPKPLNCDDPDATVGVAGSAHVVLPAANVPVRRTRRSMNGAWSHLLRCRAPS